MWARRRLIGLSLAFLLLVMQVCWLVHRLEHSLLSDETCELCLSMSGMGTALPTLEQAVAVIPPGGYLPGYAVVVRADAESVQPRQRGPPGFS